jgi:hypothetical protein
MKVSTGYRNHKNITGDNESALNGKVLKIYGSIVSEVESLTLIPATADASIGAATLLCTVSNNGAGTGINLDTTSTSGVIAKAPAETWQGTYGVTGYPSFARWCEIADAGALSTTDKRLQLTVGTVGKEFIISTALKTSGTIQRVDAAYLGEPAE